ncbi:nascent polypeptide-associated complex subunit alpha, muscle-specific form-like [Apteryx mantelli]|uniref:Nascent polypeptide-associated complex subunit alpha, muscle-specific form-like n=1 Tax=Apteryx mantelli TaxID=2696672 RepID=A0ABM4EF61_9AVES
MKALGRRWLALLLLAGAWVPDALGRGLSLGGRGGLAGSLPWARLFAAGLLVRAVPGRQSPGPGWRCRNAGKREDPESSRARPARCSLPGPAVSGGFWALERAALLPGSWEPAGDPHPLPLPSSSRPPGRPGAPPCRDARASPRRRATALGGRAAGALPLPAAAPLPAGRLRLPKRRRQPGWCQRKAASGQRHPRGSGTWGPFPVPAAVPQHACPRRSATTVTRRPGLPASPAQPARTTVPRTAPTSRAASVLQPPPGFPSQSSRGKPALAPDRRRSRARRRRAAPRRPWPEGRGGTRGRLSRRPAPRWPWWPWAPSWPPWACWAATAPQGAAGTGRAPPVSPPAWPWCPPRPPPGTPLLGTPAWCEPPASAIKPWNEGCVRLGVGRGGGSAGGAGCRAAGGGWRLARVLPGVLARGRTPPAWVLSVNPFFLPRFSGGLGPPVASAAPLPVRCFALLHRHLAVLPPGQCRPALFFRVLLFSYSLLLFASSPAGALDSVTPHRDNARSAAGPRAVELPRRRQQLSGTRFTQPGFGDGGGFPRPVSVPRRRLRGRTSSRCRRRGAGTSAVLLVGFLRARDEGAPARGRARARWRHARPPCWPGPFRHAGGSSSRAGWAPACYPPPPPPRRRRRCQAPPLAPF